jgi:hypothetical protein
MNAGATFRLLRWSFAFAHLATVGVRILLVTFLFEGTERLAFQVVSAPLVVVGSELLLYCRHKDRTHGGA